MMTSFTSGLVSRFAFCVFALAWISTSLDYPKAKAVFAAHAVKTSGMSFHQGTVTGRFSNPEASTIGR